MFGWFKGLWVRNVAGDVPAELSQCEFGCRVTDCQHGKWETCENRVFDLHPEAPYVDAPAHQNAEAVKGNLSSSPLD